MSKKTLYSTLGAIVLAVLAYVIINANAGPGRYDAFAECLTNKGVAMYGAYWCPHCQEQKKLFGKSFKKVTYIECALPGNPRGQVQECVDAKIESYPTWKFGDASRVTGEMSLEDLAEKSGCEIPVTYSL